jgi:hypothetical protein
MRYGNVTVETLERDDIYAKQRGERVSSHYHSDGKISGLAWYRRTVTAISYSKWHGGYSITQGSTGFYPKQNVRNIHAVVIHDRPHDGQRESERMRLSRELERQCMRKVHANANGAARDWTHDDWLQCRDYADALSLAELRAEVNENPE